MKKILSILMVAIAFTSCGSDDDSNDSVSLEGTWNLTYFGGETPVDFDGDGSASANIIVETGCYAGDTIVFSDNGSAAINSTTYADIAILVESGDETNASYEVTCVNDPSTETVAWSQSGNTVTITQAGAPDVVGTLDGDTLTFTVASGSDVEVINDDGTTATVIEDLSLVYEKQ